MGEPFKNFIRRETLAPLADRIAAARPGWSASRFLDAACDGLDALELKARVIHVAEALRAHLDPDYLAALDHLLDALPPAQVGTESFDGGMAMWPVLTFVERHGVAHFDRSMSALRQMTSRFSAEFAVRPFLAADMDRALATLTEWASDPNPHVRRLVSEGTRPRLPWGQQVRGLMAEPPPSLPLLNALCRDPVLYVRRSVANHIGDIAKAQPDLAVATVVGWIDGEDTPEARWIARHALRHPVKIGHAGALAAFGFHPPQLAEVMVSILPESIVLGDAVRVSARLKSASSDDQPLSMDLVLSFPSSSGRVSRKTFKWGTPTLPGGGVWEGEKKLPMRKVTTRRHIAGPVQVGLQVNGQVVAEGQFHLEVG
jgi:3-methyladenine DNA glycosylase AlkC